MKPSNMKRNDEGRQRILALMKKQRSLSSSPINQDETTLRSSSNTVEDEQKQPHHNEKDHRDGVVKKELTSYFFSNQEELTETSVIESPNTQQRNIKKRKWIQKRARAVREAISPQKLTEDYHSPSKEEDTGSLKKHSDSSTEPDDSFDNESDDNSCNESLDSSKSAEQYQDTHPILHYSSPHSKEQFTLKDVKFISNIDEFKASIE
jgi:hypothetical protein